MNEFTELEQKLNKQLPPEHIHVNLDEMAIVYYDYHGVTFRDSEKENNFVEDYIVRVATEKVGSPIKITEWGQSNNGRFAHYFERISEELIDEGLIKNATR